SGEPRQLISARRQLDDWRAAIRFARGREGINPDRIALWGTSFSGGHVITLGAEDHGIGAIVAQCPAADMSVALRRVPPRNAIKMTAASVADLARAAVGRSPHYMPAV